MHNSVIETKYVMQDKVHVLRFNKILIIIPFRVPRTSSLFPGKFGRSGKGSFIEKAKIVDGGSQKSALESTYFKVQHDPHLFSVALS